MVLVLQHKSKIIHTVHLKSKIIGLFILLSGSSFSQNGTKNFIDQPYIEVSGTVETEIIPNEIFLKIILNENDKKGKLSIEKQENEMITALKTLGIDVNKNFSIQDFNGQYTRKFLGDNHVTKIKHYQLIINDGKTLGNVYKTLDQVDISNISIIKTTHTELEKFKKETKLKALKVAKQKAHDYAKAIGQTIGNALHIQEKHFNNHLINQITSNTNFRRREYETQTSFNKIQDLNIKSIIIKESVIAKFALN